MTQWWLQSLPTRSAENPLSNVSGFRVLSGCADVLRALHKAVEYFTAMGRLSMAAKNLRASFSPSRPASIIELGLHS